MGTSVDIEWKDGPTEKEVDDLIAHLKGKEFDGSDDSTSYKPTRYVGDNGEIQHRQHTAWVNTSRGNTEGFLSKIAGIVAKRHGVEPPKVNVSNGYAYVDIKDGDIVPALGQTIGSIVSRTANSTSGSDLETLGESISEPSHETTMLADNIFVEAGDRIFVPQSATRAVEEWAKRSGVVVRFSKGADPAASQVHMNPEAKKKFISEFTPGG